METDQMTIFCVYCGNRIAFDPMKLPRFCLKCGKPVVIPQRLLKEAGHREEPYMDSENEGSTPENQDLLIEFTSAETEAPDSNAEFYSREKERLFTGWLPDGFNGYAKSEPNLSSPDFPVLLWAFAKDSRGRELFCRREKQYSINKMAPNAENPFRPFDEYLDETAASMLGTDRLRLLKRLPAGKEAEQKLYEILCKRKKQIESLSQGAMIQHVVQGEYGAQGGKLYEAELDGRKKYLLLYTAMVADEYGIYSPSLIQSQMRTNQMLQSMQAMGRIPFFNQPVQQGMPVIDTNPETPFGCHKSDGMTSNNITWLIANLSGFLSDSLPDRSEIRDFLRFINSLRIAPETEKQLQQIREQIMMKQMAEQQQVASIMGQMVRDQQASFDRRSAIMRDLNEHRENLFQQRIAADNAAFDRRSRLQHEAIMGVNTYTRTDGTTVEADVRYDRVFQRENDPTQLLGAPMTADVPFGWTELDKLK